MERAADSHKTENGIVAVVGGSRTMHGAPLFAALAAEASGVDLVHVIMPACHAEVAKATSLNFQVHAMRGDNLAKGDIEPVLELLATMDSAVLGPGVDHGNTASKDALLQIAEGASCALVLDAAALQPDTLPGLSGKRAVCTPHLGELERMGIETGDVAKVAQKHGVTFLVKGVTDTVTSPDGAVEEVTGGNAGLTVGGTGDVLAGLIAGLIAQRITPPAACALASRIVKHAGELLFQDKGYAYTARDVIGQIPQLLKEMTGTK